MRWTNNMNCCFSWFLSYKTFLKVKRNVNQWKHLQLTWNSNTSLVQIEQDELHSDNICPQFGLFYSPTLVYFFTTAPTYQYNARIIKQYGSQPGPTSWVNACRDKNKTSVLEAFQSLPPDTWDNFLFTRSVKRIFRKSGYNTQLNKKRYTPLFNQKNV